MWTGQLGENNGGRSWRLSGPNAPRGPEPRQEAQPDLTFISEDVLLKAAPPRFRKQLFTVRDLGQDRGTEGGGTETGGGDMGRQREREGEQTETGGEDTHLSSFS